MVTYNDNFVCIKPQDMVEISGSSDYRSSAVKSFESQNFDKFKYVTCSSKSNCCHHIPSSLYFRLESGGGHGN